MINIHTQLVGYFSYKREEIEVSSVCETLLRQKEQAQN